MFKQKRNNFFMFIIQLIQIMELLLAFHHSTAKIFSPCSYKKISRSLTK